MKSAVYSFVIALGIMVVFSVSLGLGAKRVIVERGPFVRQTWTVSPGTNENMAAPVQSVSRSLDPIMGVEVDGSFTVQVKRGDSYSLSISVPNDVMPYVRHEVKDGILRLSLKENTLTDTGTDNMHAVVVLPKLETLTANGSGEITVQDALTSNLKVSLVGSSKITVSGSADHVAVVITGSGSFDGGSLRSTDAAAVINGSGDATVNAKEKVEGTVAGSGNVHYRGTPHTVNKTVTGSGDVDQDDSDGDN